MKILVISYLSIMMMALSGCGSTLEGAKSDIALRVSKISVLAPSNVLLQPDKPITNKAKQLTIFTFFSFTT